MEVSSSAASQICCIFCSQKVHYRIHNSRPPIPVPSEKNLVHTTPCRVFRCTLILSSHLRLDFLYRFHHQKSVCISLPHAWHMPRQRLHRLNEVQFPVASYHFLPARSKYIPKHPVLKHHQTLSFFNVRILTSNAQVRSQISLLWDLWWTKWYWDIFSPIT